MGYVKSRKYPDWAGDRECGTESRAISVARQIGIKSFDSYNDARSVNAECKRQNNPAPAPAAQNQNNSPNQNPMSQLGNYVAQIGDRGYTAAEYDFYTTQENKKLDAALQDARDKRLGQQSLALQSLINDAANYAQDAETSRNVYSEDASTYRTVYQTDALERTEKYRSDMDSFTKINVAGIQGEYGLDLAKIQNEGSKAVAAIQGEYGLASDKIRGKTAENVEGIRGGYERYKADRNLDANVFGGLVGGFW
jgi:hypothetical protein